VFTDVYIYIATALTSDGQLRREPAISGTTENTIFREILWVGRQARVSVPLLREGYSDCKRITKLTGDSESRRPR